MRRHKAKTVGAEKTVRCRFPVTLSVAPRAKGPGAGPAGGPRAALGQKRKSAVELIFGFTLFGLFLYGAVNGFERIVVMSSP
jgi:hypothetical protein